MNQSEYSLIISILALCVASSALLLNYIKHRRETKHKIVVQFYHDIIYKESGEPGIANAEGVFVLVITNHSMMSKSINIPVVVDKKAKYSALVTPDKDVEYPYKLAYGEQLLVRYRAEDQFVHFDWQHITGKVRAYVSDTVGNSYYSKWLDTEALMEQFVGRIEGYH